ncbi:MAG: hypothetical protein R8K53_08720, partial [Mariprofundaceae bacterium]
MPTHKQASTIGPYHNISARLLVIEPKRRWQVMLDWQAQQTHGRARLVHAASGNIVELRWRKDDIRLRDNRSPNWRKINMQQLAEHGIVISPYTLSRFLAGQIPSGFHRKNAITWESKRDDALIRVVWHADGRRLIISDIRHGRRATLLITDTNLSQPGS